MILKVSVIVILQLTQVVIKIKWIFSNLYTVSSAITYPFFSPKKLKCALIVSFLSGMNFYDFFTFIARFSLVNLVILFHLHRDYENQIWSSSPVARHLALNLVSIQKIALKMKSVDDVAGSFELFMDLKETLDDPELLKLCMGLCRTYGMIHEEEKWTCEMKKASMLDFEDYNSLISSPEDLVKFIDFAVGKFSGNCSEQNILLSKLEDG